MSKKYFFLISGCAVLLIFSFYKIIQTQNISKELGEKKIVFNQLQDRFVRLDSEFKEALKIINPLKEKSSNLKKTLEEKEAYIDQLTKDIERIGLSKENSNNNLQGALDRLNSLNSELELIKIDKAALEKANRKLQKNLVDTAGKLELAQEKIRDSRDNFSQTKKINKTLKEQINELTGIIKNKEEEDGKIAVSLKEQAALNKDLAIKIQKTEEAYLNKENEFQGLKLLKESKEVEIAGLNSKLSAIAKAGQYLEDQLLKIEKRSSFLENELNRINNQLQERITLNSSLENRITVLSQSLNNKEKEQLESVKALEELRAKLNEKEREFFSLKEELSQANAKLDTLDKELGFVRGRQKKTAEQLNLATAINASLQESLIGLSHSISQPFEVKSETKAADTADNQEKAGELRRKVEVILDSNQEQK